MRLSEHEPPRVFFWSDPVEPGKLFWPKLLPEKPGCRFLPWPDRSLWRCWLELALPEPGIYLLPLRRINPPSFLLTRLMPLAGHDQWGLSADTMNGNKPLTKFWWRWTGLNPTNRWVSWQLPIEAIF